ncbi:AAA domain-containing protein [Corallococcus exiguus]|uniref:AAA family ATPase n=1 Tax=Corallococcus TaxID=83461 RepID=UPI000EBE4FC1|nr:MULTISPECIES: AAA family ATPase [Corallococcus]NNB90551.1 AAA domain-containing protein [Corallococcus exiguus]NNB97586.1 AAA domain-containing protein [Corallococcus exiguus]NPC48616.1 AAA domain-containing protein [Corallococcus exiguus]RKH82560.1 AAA family ATPase [Corallococcus sp. AB032C]
MSVSFEVAAAEVRDALTDASRGLVEREAMVELVALSAVAGEHLLVVGPPGTAKSEAVRRTARGLGGAYFEYLLGRFTEPSEIFGPVDLRKLREGLVETETAGMLPEAEVAFLDEVFLGSTAILNTLLGLLNERTFRRGHTRMQCPLRVCVGASNALPEDDALAAFADRFLARIFVEPVPDPRLEELLEGGASLWADAAPRVASLQSLDVVAQAARRADLGPVRPHLAQALRTLRAAGIALSDRRAVKVQRLVAAAAALAGRTTPGVADLWPLVYAVPTKEAQALARDVLRDVLSASENLALPAAALEASAGPLARAQRIAQAGHVLLESRPVDGDVDAVAAWRLKLEGVAREMDAGFAPEALPEALRALRGAVAAVLEDVSTRAA